jgi:hypothetical protein
MEHRLSNGTERLEDIARNCYKLADCEGITGLMAILAVIHLYHV